jgi:hypothetical protein
MSAEGTTAPVLRVRRDGAGTCRGCSCRVDREGLVHRHPPTTGPPRPRSRAHARIGAHQAGTSVQPAGSGQPAASSRRYRQLVFDDPSQVDAFWTRSGRAHPRSTLSAARKVRELQAKPSVGLEPTTPSLPWKVVHVTGVHPAQRAGTKSLHPPEFGLYDRDARARGEANLMDPRWTRAPRHHGRRRCRAILALGSSGVAARKRRAHASPATPTGLRSQIAALPDISCRA